MRVLMYYPEDLDQPRGTRNRMINLAEAVAQDHEVYVAAASAPKNRRCSFRFVKLEHFRWLRKFSKYLNFIQVWKVVRRIRPDIIYSFTEASLPTLLPSARLYKIPHLVEVQSIVVEDVCGRYQYFKKEGAVYRCLQAMVTWMLRKTEVQVMGCEPLMKYYEGKLPKMMLMPPSIDTGVFNDRVNPDHGLVSVKKKRKRLLVMYAGNFNYYQGTDFLLEIVKELRARNLHDFLFAFVGNPTEEFKEKVKTFQVEKDVILAGLVPNDKVASYLRAADILVIPRLDTMVTRFAFPSKHLEYMAVGRCIVSTKTWPSKELIGHLKCGLLAETTVDDFIANLLLAREKSLRDRLGKNAAYYIKTKFSVKQDAQRLDTLFQQLVQKRQKT